MVKASTPRRRQSVALGRAVPLRIIESEADIRAGVAALRRLCPTMKRLHGLIGDPPLRRNEPGFAGLARVVVGQQLSIASASAIWGRTAIAVDPFDPERLLGLDEAVLRTAGLSRGKVRTLKAIAEAVISGALDFDRPVTSTELREAMLTIGGIGPWTADIYTMFCLGEADAFASGDLALQLAAQRAFGLETRPSARDLEQMAERWRPWRGVAARMLWAFYAHRDPI